LQQQLRLQQSGHTANTEELHGGCAGRVDDLIEQKKFPSAGTALQTQRYLDVLPFVPQELLMSQARGQHRVRNSINLALSTTSLEPSAYLETISMATAEDKTLNLRAPDDDQSLFKNASSKHQSNPPTDIISRQ